MTEENGTRNLAGEHAKHLAQLEGLRSAGDYDSAFAISSDDLRSELGKARRLVEQARRLVEQTQRPAD